MVYLLYNDNYLIKDINDYLNNEFNKNGIKSVIINDKNMIKDYESIFFIIDVSNDDEMGSEIIYELSNNNILASILEYNLKNYLTVNKVYQLRSDKVTNKNYYEILENNSLNSLIFRLGYLPNDEKNIIKNLDFIKKNIYNSLFNYIKGINYYVVRNGDSISSISKKFNISINEIKEINNITKDSLSVGEVLIIPINEYYVVSSGDSLYSISRRFNISVDDLKRINNLSSNLLSIGQVLFISDNNLNNDNSNNYNDTYTVKKGDSLYSISRMFNTSVDELKRINNLSSNLLSIGQVLKLNNSSNIVNDSSVTYVVKKGDSLYSIAKRFNTTVDNLKRINNLNNNLLSINQKIKVS